MEWHGPIKPTYFDLPEDLRKKLKAEAARRDKTIRVAVQEALEVWLQEDGGNRASESDIDVERLLELKRIGDPRRVAALLENIVVFLENARRALRARKRKETET